LFVLAWLHTAGFLFFNHLEGNSFVPWFWGFTLSAGVAQLAGFVHTVRSPRGPSPQRAPAKDRAREPSGRGLAVGMAAAVTTLWIVFVSIVYLLERMVQGAG